MANLPALPAQGSTSWYTHYTGLHTQGDAQEATLANHTSRISALEGAPNVPLSGVVQVDSFAGATDDDKLDAALSYAAAQTRIPYIQFPPRSFAWNKPGRIPFSGMKLIGPNSPGWKNLEINSGKLVNHRIMVGASIGTGTQAMFYGGGAGADIYDVYVGNLAFQANINGQFWDQHQYTLYCAEFHALNFYGMANVIGRPNVVARVTVLNTTGVWTVHVYNGTQGAPFHFGGSDCQLWMAGEMNLQGGVNGNGTYLMEFENMSKTNVGRVYCTSPTGWKGARIYGTSRGLNFFGSTFEGYNAGNTCHGSLVRWEGSSPMTSVGAMYGCWFGYAMTAPATLGGDNNGYLDIRGGSVLVDRPYFARADSQATNETVPMIYASGANTEVHARMAGRITGSQGENPWTGRPRLQVVGGASVTADATYTLI